MLFWLIERAVKSIWWVIRPVGGLTVKEKNSTSRRLPFIGIHPCLLFSINCLLTKDEFQGKRRPYPISTPFLSHWPGIISRTRLRKKGWWFPGVRGKGMLLGTCWILPVSPSREYFLHLPYPLSAVSTHPILGLIKKYSCWSGVNWIQLINIFHFHYILYILESRKNLMSHDNKRILSSRKWKLEKNSA